MPYPDNGPAWGGQNKTAFKAAKRRARTALFAEARREVVALRAAGRRDEALQVLLSARNDMRLLRRLTQRWFRHLMASRMAHRGLRGTMEQAGWDDHRSVMGDVHDVAERPALVSEFDDLGMFLTREETSDAAKPCSTRKIRWSAPPFVSERSRFQPSLGAPLSPTYAS